MMVLDLRCAQGHIFEGWFSSLQTFEEQKTKQLIQCPHCEDHNIKRMISPVMMKKMTFATPVEREGLSIDYQRQAQEVVKYINMNFDNVGPEFTKEALKMHYNVIDKKNIRGSATVEEEKILQTEGVTYFKIPFSQKESQRKNDGGFKPPCSSRLKFKS